MEVDKILTDGDLDGVMCGAILLRVFPKAEVIFGHPGELKSGLLDDIVDYKTIICDLPHHPNCGVSIDHHHSNRPPPGDDGSNRIWAHSPSAARIVANLFEDLIEIGDLEEALYWTDKLDSGDLTKEEFLSQEPMIWIGRSLGHSVEFSFKVMRLFSDGLSPREVSANVAVSEVIQKLKRENEDVIRIVSERLEIVDRLAIVRMHGLGVRTNGYAVTSLVGEACDACMITHGSYGGGFGMDGDYPLSASFYTNSFLHSDGGIFDLTALAKRFDPDGGGHRDACGCRIIPRLDKSLGNDAVLEDDVEMNIREWIKIWQNRERKSYDVLM